MPWYLNYAIHPSVAAIVVYYPFSSGHTVHLHLNSRHQLLVLLGKAKLDIGVLATVGVLYRNHINCIWGVFGRDLLVRGAQRMACNSQSSPGSQC